MGVVDEAIADRIRVSRLGDMLVPALRRQLAGHDGRSRAVPILEHLEQIAALAFGDRRDRPVVEHEHVGARDLGEQAWIGSVGARERELGE